MTPESASVLLVEDHQDTRDMLELLFQEWGYSVTLAANATQGLKHLLAHQFDLIVLDNWLPDLDGTELCRLIREVDRQTPIIFFSAAAMGSEDRQALAKGANAYIHKGNGLGPLREAMAQELGKSPRQSQKPKP